MIDRLVKCVKTPKELRKTTLPEKKKTSLLGRIVRLWN